jgi:glutamate carboxypeptidase
VPTLDGLGAVGGSAHAENEHILLDQLVPRTALLVALVADMLLPDATMPMGAGNLESADHRGGPI